MANTLLNPAQIVAQSVGILIREQVLGGLFMRASEADFAYQSARGRSYDMRFPARLAARQYTLDTRTSPIVTDDLTESVVNVKLDTHLYSAVSITDEQMTFDIDNWGERVAQPQMNAIVEATEVRIAAAIAATDTQTDIVWHEGDNPFVTAIKGRQTLNKAGVPLAGRFWLVGAAAEAEIFGSENLLNQFTYGGDQSAIRDASLGTLAGFQVIGSPYLPDDFSAFAHPTALAVAQVAPVVPEGVSAGATVSSGATAMRWVRDYDSLYMRDRSVFSAFMGVSDVKDGVNFSTQTPTGKNARIAFAPLTSA